jgi:RNA polymerase sigma-70 factor (ECF subfamily)
LGWFTKKPPPASFTADLQLAKRCLAKDEAARAELFTRYAPVLFPVLRRLVRSEADAEDLLQQSFLEALLSLHRYRGDAALGSWLHTIAVRSAYRQMRKVRPTISLELVKEERSNDPNAQLESRGLLRRIESLLEKITPKRRIAFLLYEVEGHTLPEVANLLEISQVAAKKRILSAHQELRELTMNDPELRAAFAKRSEKGGENA